MDTSRLAHLNGAVDLTRLDCVGCRYRELPAGETVGACKRFPPVFRPVQPAIAPDGRQGVVPGGWTFPPAAQRCGEFARHDA